MKKTAATILIACLAPFCLAAEPTDATVERFLNAYQFEPIREAWAFRLDREMKMELARLKATPGLADNARNAIGKYETAASSELQTALSSASLRPRYAAIFKKVFTEEEMLEITRFYESPAGKASVQKRPLISSLIQEQFQSLSEGVARDLAGVRQEVEQAVAKAKRQ